MHGRGVFFCKRSRFQRSYGTRTPLSRSTRTARFNISTPAAACLGRRWCRVPSACPNLVPRRLLQQARPSPATTKPIPPPAPAQAAARAVEAGGFEGGGRGEGDAEVSKEAARKEAKRLAFMEDRARIQVFVGETGCFFWEVE